MTQLSLIDPREHPIVTKAMHDDSCLRDAIRFMRTTSGSKRSAWPFVEHVGTTLGGSAAWAVDDAGEQYVVIGRTIFRPSDIEILSLGIRTAAMDVFGRFNWDASHPALAS